MNIIILSSLVVVVAIITLFIKQEKTVRTLSSIFATIISISVIVMVSPQLLGQTAMIQGWWMIDGFSALMATLIAVLYLTTIWVSYRYIGHEHHEGLVSDLDVRVYFTLLHLFVLSMLLVVLTNHTLVLWLALESTTLTSTFLVGLYRKKTSIEAAWKYIIICSTGITLALIGILLLGFGAHGGETGQASFLLSDLLKYALFIPEKVVKWAFIFIFVGFGVKAGFAPTHSWLPDAHGNAPSPISALFSGILLNVAMYAIIRFQTIANHALGGHQWTGMFFLVFGALSILLPAFLLLIQTNYKRMLAYSSIEHMGLITLGLAVPPIGTMAAVMHITGHALVKSSLFFGSGEILSHYQTTHIEKIKNLLKIAPYTAILFTLGILGIIAMPPSALFISEYTLIVALIKTHVILTIFMLASLGAIAYAMLKTTLGMVISDPKELLPEVKEKEKWNLTHTIMTVQLSAVVVLAIWFSTPQGQQYFLAIANKLF